MDERSSSLFTNSRINTVVFVVLILLGLFLFAETLKAFREYRYVGGDALPSSTITVQGEGEAFAIPDIAEFSFSVIESATTVQEAQKKATDRMNQALGYIKEQNIEERDIKTIGYNIYPKYEAIQAPCYRDPCPQPRQTGFEVTQTISVKVRDTAKAGDLLGGVGNLGVQNISGVNFTVDDHETVMAQAREKAIADAKAKAEKLAQELNVRLVRVVSYTDNQGGWPMPYYKQGYDMAVAQEGMGGTGAMPTANIPTGENQVKASVSITYEIR